jgi:hypothetical protein
MIYLKSALAGVVAVVAALIVTVLAMTVLLMIKSRDLPAGQAISWDPISFYRNSIVAWVCLALAFLIGFAWEYRRVFRVH